MEHEGLSVATPVPSQKTLVRHYIWKSEIKENSHPQKKHDMEHEGRSVATPVPLQKTLVGHY